MPHAEQLNDLFDNFCPRLLLEHSRLSFKQLKIRCEELPGTSIASRFKLPSANSSSVSSTAFGSAYGLLVT
jgi:hypothetical protein